uniref:Uncharacterized protein n=1 Tax=Glossina palpalis gambiensis TaxID=67801 RepID=A0A1B0BHT1_9MUSC
MDGLPHYVSGRILEALFLTGVTPHLFHKTRDTLLLFFNKAVKQASKQASKQATVLRLHVDIIMDKAALRKAKKGESKLSKHFKHLNLSEYMESKE